MTEGHLAAE